MCGHSPQSTTFQWHLPSLQFPPSSSSQDHGKVKQRQVTFIKHVPFAGLGWFLTCLDLFRPYSQSICREDMVCPTLKMGKWRCWEEKWPVKVTVGSNFAACWFQPLLRQLPLHQVSVSASGNLGATEEEVRTGLFCHHQILGSEWCISKMGEGRCWDAGLLALPKDPNIVHRNPSKIPASALTSCHLLWPWIWSSLWTLVLTAWQAPRGWWGTIGLPYTKQGAWPSDDTKQNRHQCLPSLHLGNWPPRTLRLQLSIYNNGLLIRTSVTNLLKRVPGFPGLSVPHCRERSGSLVEITGVFSFLISGPGRRQRDVHVLGLVREKSNFFFTN